jgi:hypothetical protein
MNTLFVTQKESHGRSASLLIASPKGDAEEAARRQVFFPTENGTPEGVPRYESRSS